MARSHLDDIMTAPCNHLALESVDKKAMFHKQLPLRKKPLNPENLEHTSVSVR
jgi:hypothetical protein